MTNLKAIQERAEKARGLPWELVETKDLHPPFEAVFYVGMQEYITAQAGGYWNYDSSVLDKPTADFIAHAREDIPMLLEALAEAREKLEAVEWLRIPHAYKCSGYDDGGECDCYRRGLDAILGGSE